MRQESNCVHEMIEIWYDVQKMRSLEHVNVFGFKCFFNEETNTTTAFIYCWSVK